MLDWLRLLRVPGLGPVLAGRLLDRFGDPGAVLAASDRALRQVEGVGPGVAGAVLRMAGDGEGAARAAWELDRLAAMGGEALVWGSPAYPELLATIHDPPPVLFVQGDPAFLASTMVAVVGSRQASQGGLEMARRLGTELSLQGLVTVSGLAIGIDTAAHWGALEGGGATVAVLATGLDQAYPVVNRRLREKILGRGCLVTEAFLGTPPVANLFPRRNRIISGLSRGVVVVEAAMKSGSLVTARLALEQGREVFAVPGNVLDPRSRGVNQLIRDGARLTEGVEDILEELSWTGIRHPQAVPAEAGGAGSPESGAVADLMALLGEGPIEADLLARRSRLTVGELSRILLRLEMTGIVERLPGNRLALRGR
ncbi:MAG: DNA-protecting protein DprA [Magnetococcales bacterium]|nr:DNA-protecting protein DprA [Magnetococcales bacterium]